MAIMSSDGLLCVSYSDSRVGQPDCGSEEAYFLSLCLHPGFKELRSTDVFRQIWVRFRTCTRKQAENANNVFSTWLRPLVVVFFLMYSHFMPDLLFSIFTPENKLFLWILLISKNSFFFFWRVHCHSIEQDWRTSKHRGKQHKLSTTLAQQSVFQISATVWISSE